MRTATVQRKTKETEVSVTINLDGTGVYDISTGIGFLDHMLEQLSRHSLIDLTVRAKGDLHIDFHHTNEDVGIVIGEALTKALGDRRGIVRYGAAAIPMDETMTRVSLDCSNRPYLVWRVKFPQGKLGDMDTELFKEFFQAVARADVRRALRQQSEALCRQRSPRSSFTWVEPPRNAGEIKPEPYPLLEEPDLLSDPNAVLEQEERLLGAPALQPQLPDSRWAQPRP